MATLLLSGFRDFVRRSSEKHFESSYRNGAERSVRRGGVLLEAPSESAGNEEINYDLVAMCGLHDDN
jgi:hypothetical protein